MRQNQVWAVLRADDDRERVIWSLAAGLIGRLCVSGDADQLEQWADDDIRTAVTLSAHTAELIDSGQSRVFGDADEGSWNHPSGHQVVIRHNPDRLLVIVHRFAHGPSSLSVTLPSIASSGWRITHALSQTIDATWAEHVATFNIPAASTGDCAGVWLLEK